MNELITEYLEMRQKELSPRSLVEYGRDLRDLDFWLTERNLGIVNANRLILREYIAKVPVGRRLAKRKLSAIRTFYSYLKDKGLISDNPAFTLKVSVGKRIPKPLKQYELDTVLDACNYTFKTIDPILPKTIVKTFYYTGIRLDELTKMSIYDIDFDSKRITVIGKGDKERPVLFSSSLSTQFKDYSIWRDTKKKKGEWAWFIYNRGLRITRSQVGYIFTRLSKKTGIHVHPHLLRHTFASHALDKGMNLVQIQELLGHEDISTTGMYVHIIGELGESYDKAFP